MPTASFGDIRDDLAIGTLTDHERRFEVAVVLEMSDGGKELLVPGAQHDPAAAPEMVHPSFFILDPYPERQAVKPNKMVEKRMKPSGSK
jgi:hypothetical protein